MFRAPGTWRASPAAEIAEIRWLDIRRHGGGQALPRDLAPLLTDHILPLLAAAPMELTD